MGSLSALQTPLILFLLVVAPIWIMSHYRYKNRVTEESSTQDREKIQELLNLAAKMEERIHTLENILDKQHPDWRHEI